MKPEFSMSNIEIICFNCKEKNEIDLGETFELPFTYICHDCCTQWLVSVMVEEIEVGECD
jgi:hypothetical protein